MALDSLSANESERAVSEARTLAEAATYSKPQHREAVSLLMMTDLTTGRIRRQLNDQIGRTANHSNALATAASRRELLKSRSSVGDMLFDLTVCYDVIDKPGVAADVLEQEVHRAPRDLSPYAIASMAIIYYRMGDADKAIAICDVGRYLWQPMYSAVRIVKVLADADRFRAPDDARCYLADYMAKYRERREHRCRARNHARLLCGSDTGRNPRGA